MTDRAFPRYAVEAAVTLRDGETALVGKTTNLSRGGVAGQVNGSMTIGAQITVELALIFDDQNVSEMLALPARVVWSTSIDDGYQIGLAFKKLSEDQTQYLDLFLKYLLDQPRRPTGESDHADLFSQRSRK